MKELLGGCIQAVGILIAGLFGLCTIIMFVGLNSWRSFGAAVSAMAYAVVPFLIGVGLIVLGRAMVRSARGDDRWGI